MDFGISFGIAAPRSGARTHLFSPFKWKGACICTYVFPYVRTSYRGGSACVSTCAKRAAGYAKRCCDNCPKVASRAPRLATCSVGPKQPITRRHHARSIGCNKPTMRVLCWNGSRARCTKNTVFGEFLIRVNLAKVRILLRLQ